MSVCILKQMVSIKWVMVEVFGSQLGWGKLNRGAPALMFIQSRGGGVKVLTPNVPFLQWSLVNG